MIDLPEPHGRPEVLSVRPADTSDLDRLVELHRQACTSLATLRGGSALTAERERGSTGSEIRTSFMGAIDDPGSLVLVGALGEAVLGHAVLLLGAPRGSDRRPGPAVLEELFVEPDAREVGIGSALLAEARRMAALAGCNGIDAIALPGDRGTKNFFEDHSMVARAIVVHGSVGP